MVNVPKQWARVGDARQLSWEGFGSFLAHPECHPQGPLNSSFLIPLSPGRASGQRSINHMFVVYSEHVDASILERKKLQKWEEYQGMAAALVVGSGSRLGQWAYLHFLFCLSLVSHLLLLPQLSTCSPDPNSAPCSSAERAPINQDSPSASPYLLLIDFLPPVGHLIANDGANIFDDHCVLF